MIEESVMYTNFYFKKEKTMNVEQSQQKIQ